MKNTEEREKEIKDEKRPTEGRDRERKLAR